MFADHLPFFIFPSWSSCHYPYPLPQKVKRHNDNDPSRGAIVNSELSEKKIAFSGGGIQHYGAAAGMERK